MSPRIRFSDAAIFAIAVMFVAQPARAVCTYNALTSDVTLPATTTPTLYQFNQGVDYWTAVAVRPQSGDDWDISVYGATAADPVCVTNLLASSTFGLNALDFVIGDFNHNVVGTYYASASRFSGTKDGSVQWDDGADIIPVNGAPVTQSMASTDLIRVYDIQLTAGTTYTFDFYSPTALGGHLLLFRNAGGGTYWVGRGSAEFDVTGPTTYTAPANGFYGVVVTSDLGNAFTYSLGVTQSACAIATSLSAFSSITIAPSSGNIAFECNNNFWMGLAVRATTGDWDTQMYGLPSGGAPPTCFSNLLATSAYGAGVVDITMGDFDFSPLGWYFGYPHIFSGGNTCQVQFTSTTGFINVNDNPLTGTTVAADVAQSRDVYLTGGRTYAFTFSPSLPGLTMLLFANVGGGAYFTGRSGAVISSTTSTTYTAPVTGWYGVVVVNDGAVAASYQIGVSDCLAVTALSNDVSVGTGTADNAYFSFNQVTNYWTAVAVRNPVLDWDIVASQDNVISPAPACATIPLASSGTLPPTMDFIVGDFNHNAFGTYYVRAHQFTAGPADPATVEWDSGSDFIFPNDNNQTIRATGPTDLIGCWDIYLAAGQSYDFVLTDGAAADLHLLVFRNVGGGTYWNGRAGAEFTTTFTHTYVAPSSGIYGVVVVNDNGVADTYGIRVHTCDPIVALAPAPSLTSSFVSPEIFASFNQINDYWTPVSVRSTGPPGEDWDIHAYSSPVGGPTGICMSANLANSILSPPFTDYVIGDFNFVPTGTYYARGERFSGVGSADMQWFQGGQILPLGGPNQLRTKPAGFQVESWDAFLSAGQTYTVYFSHFPTLDVKVDVFQSTGAPFWGGRQNRLVESSYTISFVAPTTGFYGIVVVNDGASGGPFAIGLYTGAVSVDGTQLPDRDALKAISPNPGRTGIRFDYALKQGNHVAFDVWDISGRLVSHLEPGDKGAGEWSDAWSATDTNGRPLHAGVYLVRMRAGDQVIGMRKVTLLE
jgi:hypothetical protein